MGGQRTAACWAAACTAALFLSACTDDDVTVGSQCPTGWSGRATLAPDASAAPAYGTSCAPCAGDEPTLDARGCPVLVTWASCGGDICIGSRLLPVPVFDAGPDGAVPDGAAPDAGADAGPVPTIDAGDQDAGVETTP